VLTDPTAMPATHGDRQQVQQPARSLSPVLPGDRQRRGYVQIVQQCRGDRGGGVRGPVRSPGRGVQGLQVGGRRVEVALAVFPFGLPGAVQQEQPDRGRRVAAQQVTD